MIVEGDAMVRAELTVPFPFHHRLHFLEGKYPAAVLALLLAFKVELMLGHSFLHFGKITSVYFLNIASPFLHLSEQYIRSVTFCCLWWPTEKSLLHHQQHNL